MDNNELGRFGSGADRAFVPDGIEPVPVSPVPASIPSVDAIETEVAEMWLWLGRVVREVVTQGTDWICDDPEASKQAVQWLEISQDCLFRAARLAQAIEARQGGNGAAGAVHESAVRQDAPKSSPLSPKGIQ